MKVELYFCSANLALRAFLVLRLRFISDVFSWMERRVRPETLVSIFSSNWSPEVEHVPFLRSELPGMRNRSKENDSSRFGHTAQFRQPTTTVLHIQMREHGSAEGEVEKAIGKWQWWRQFVHGEFNGRNVLLAPLYGVRIVIRAEEVLVWPEEFLAR